MRTKRLPQKLFLKTFQFVPRLAVNLLIEDGEGKVLLTKRKKEPYQDYWHLPGSFLLKGELLLRCAQRVVMEELDITLEENKLELAGVFDDIENDPRGHVVDIVYRYKIENEVFLIKPIGDTKEVAFFGNLPIKMGFNHKETLRKLGFK